MIVSVRPMRSGDVPAVARIEAESFAQPWSAAMLADEVGQRLGWADVATDSEGAVVGYLLGRRYPGEWHLVNVAVALSCRRVGVARQLVERFLEAADAMRCVQLLEVRPGNEAARRLYEGYGFAETGVRKNYYPESGEDAVTMQRRHCAGGMRQGDSILAIETSCDDSAAAVLALSGTVLSSVTHSQDSIHQRYGGVVPEAASRAHTERLSAVVREALHEAGRGFDDLAGVAVTVGPGLIGALLVGVQTAKAVAWSRRLPLFPVNHIHGHLAAAWLSDADAPFPMVTLVASGGHTALIEVLDRRTYRPLGETLDDAAGEAFDKGARLLGLGYPGGRELDVLAEKGDPRAFSFPIGLQRSSRLDFSFSGVKTALYYVLRDMSDKERLDRSADVAASYREAIVSALVGKATRAAAQRGARTLAAVGGVAANSLLRRRLREAGEAAGLHVIVPPIAYCTDNAAMIGMAALSGIKLPYPDYLGLDASASLRLGDWCAPETS